MKYSQKLFKSLYIRLLLIHSFTLCFIFCLISCKKKDNKEDLNIVLKMLEGKWTFLSYQTNQHYSGNDHLNTVSGSIGDYMNFAAGGKLYLRLQTFQDTSLYSLFSSSRMVIDGVDTFDLKTLTESQLILYRKKVSSSTDYYEQTYNLQK